jgi:hypothetical protein
MTKSDQDWFKTIMLRFIVSLALLIIGQSSALVWWAASITAQQKFNTATLTKHATEIEQNSDYRKATGGAHG